MARMIPSCLPSSADTKIANSERRLFDKLRDGPNTSGWVILHSVKVPGETKRSNPKEVDFLIMVPEHGVICLEVKGDNIVYKPGDKKWYREHGDNYPVQDPVKQSEDAMNALHKHLKDKVNEEKDRELSDKIHRLPISHALAFTDKKYEKDERPHGILVCDAKESLNQAELCKKLVDYAETLPYRGHNKIKLDAATMKFIVETLRPELAMRHMVTSGPDLADIERKLLEFTKEQYDALEMVQDENGVIRNKRILFEGGAGTGKTMLAIELARRRHKAGDRVAVVCSGKMLGKWLAKQLPDIPVVGEMIFAMDMTAEAHLAWKFAFDVQMANFVRVCNEGGSGEYTAHLIASKAESDFIFLCLDKIEKEERQWDYLIVDEFQFFNRDDLDYLDMCLDGGLSEGRWVMFGDSEFQGYHIAENRFLREIDDSWCAQPHTRETKEHLLKLCPGSNEGKGWSDAQPLRTNCRNTRSIARAVYRVVRRSAPAVKPSQIAGPDVDYHYYTGDHQQCRSELLGKVLDGIQKDGVEPKQVAVLDLYSVTLHLKEFGPWKLWAYSMYLRAPDSDNYVGVYTMSEFKGMESDLIIFILPNLYFDDIKMEDEYLRNVTALQAYEGMTRAKGKLIVIAHKSWQSWFERDS